jgi:hypothetical protein
MESRTRWPKNWRTIWKRSDDLFALLVGDDRSEVLNLDQPLSDKHDLGYIGDNGHPGIANRLRNENGCRYNRGTLRTHGNIIPTELWQIVGWSMAKEPQ